MGKEYEGAKSLVLVVMCSSMTAMVSAGDRLSTAISPSELRGLGSFRSCGADPEGCIVYLAKPFSRDITPSAVSTRKSSAKSGTRVTIQEGVVPHEDHDDDQELLNLAEHPVSSPSKGATAAMAAFTLTSPRPPKTPSAERVVNLKRRLQELLGNDEALTAVVGDDGSYKNLCALVAAAAGAKKGRGSRTDGAALVPLRPRSSSLKGPRPNSTGGFGLQRMPSVPATVESAADSLRGGAASAGEEVAVKA